jgi:hypothetical protein
MILSNNKIHIFLKDCKFNKFETSKIQNFLKKYMGNCIKSSAGPTCKTAKCVLLSVMTERFKELLNTMQAY